MIHELGHFTMARIFGVTVEKFSIGFGPKLLSFTKNETEYRISLIPLGGYVKMKGENPDEETKDQDSYKTKTWWQRALIAFAGPLANFFLALLIFIISFSIGKSYEDYLPVVGLVNNDSFQIQKDDRIIAVNDHDVLGWSQIIKYTNQDDANNYLIERDGHELNITNSNSTKETWVTNILPFTTTIIGEVAPGLPAYEAGLMENDIILAVDDNPVDDWYKMRNAISSSIKDTVKLSIERDGQTFHKYIKLGLNIIDDSRIIGITQSLPIKLTERFNLLESVKFGTYTTISFVAMNYAMLYKLIANPETIKDNLGGPIMIYTMSQQTVNKGWDSILSFFAAISIVLMIMNLLPIPILDGGHIFFCIIEAIRGNPLSLKIQIALQNIGMVLLMMLMLFAFWNDLTRIFLRTTSIKQQRSESLLN